MTDELDAKRAAEAESKVAGEIIDLRQALKAQEQRSALDVAAVAAEAAGVTGEAAQRFVGEQMVAAQADAGDGFDRAAWLASWLEDNPAFVGRSARPAPLPTGGGHPPGKGNSEIRSRARRIRELEQKPLADLSTDDRAELSALLQQQQRADRRGKR